MHARKILPTTVPSSARVVTIFASFERALAALGRLERTGFDTGRFSIIGKEEPSHAHEFGLAVAGARAQVWGRRAALWNHLANGASATALAWVPFVGPVIAVGPAASLLAGRAPQAPADIRISALRRMLTLSGMSAGEAQTYEAAVRGGQIVLLLHGGERDAARARHVVHGAVAPIHVGAVAE